MEIANPADNIKNIVMLLFNEFGDIGLWLIMLNANSYLAIIISIVLIFSTRDKLRRKTYFKKVCISFLVAFVLFLFTLFFALYMIIACTIPQ